MPLFLFLLNLTIAKSFHNLKKFRIKLGARNALKGNSDLKNTGFTLCPRVKLKVNVKMDFAQYKMIG